jgi:hypothetical protein
MNHTFTDHEVIEIQAIKKKIRNGISKALLPVNKTLRSHLISNCIVTGGCSYSSFYNQEPNDWDLLFKDEQASLSFKHYITANKADVMEAGVYAGVQFTGKLITTNAVTLKNKVQVIDWKWQRNNFDFIHCMPWYNIKEDKYHIAKEQYDAIKNKKLVINDSLKFKFNNRRLKKWLDRGFASLSADDILKLTEEIK